MGGVVSTVFNTSNIKWLALLAERRAHRYTRVAETVAAIGVETTGAAAAVAAAVFGIDYWEVR